MTNRKYTIWLVSCIFLMLLALLGFYVTRNRPTKTVTDNLTPSIRTIVENRSGEWSSKVRNEDAYRLDCLKINSVGFQKEGDDLFVKYQLGGNLPTSTASLPSIGRDKVRSITFYLSLDENYYGPDGSVNPGGDDASLKISFYGNAETVIPTSKIVVNGQLADGGPGHDFFIVKFPYYQVLFGPHEKIAFSTNSYLTSEYAPMGAAAYVFKNTELSPKEDPDKIIIDRP